MKTLEGGSGAESAPKSALCAKKCTAGVKGVRCRVCGDLFYRLRFEALEGDDFEVGGSKVVEPAVQLLHVDALAVPTEKRICELLSIASSLN